MKIIKKLIITLLVGAALWAASAKWQQDSIEELLSQNKKLKQAITNLTKEDQIGYAKVIRQEDKNGIPHTTFKFVETARDDKSKLLLEKTYTIKGDVIHFDALIVKFDNKMVLDGSNRSLYLWRRVYGEHRPPEEGFPIEKEGQEPERYQNFLGELSLMDKFLLKENPKEKFWSSIWDLANDQKKLQQFGITAVYGDVKYLKMQPKFIYIFKITNTGSIFPEIVPEL